MAGDDRLEKIADDFVLTLMRIPPIVHRKLQSLGISGMQAAGYKVLAVLSVHGCLPISEIGKHLFVSKPYMTRLIGRLIDDGFVEKVPDRKDRRVINVVITREGMRHLKTFPDLFRADIRAVISDMDEQELGTVSASLESINRVLERLGRV
jgi:DNA-binding MarR family transcriptional regulator